MSLQLAVGVKGDAAAAEVHGLDGAPPPPPAAGKGVDEAVDLHRHPQVSPDLRVIICSDEQLEIGWEKDYLGAFEFEETYQSGSGYTVNILRDNAVEEKDTHTGYKTKCCAIFVADGIRYTLSGQVEIEKMKEIVNSMHY